MGTTTWIPDEGGGGGGGGSGTVTDVSVVTANGVSGTVATSTTTPAITLILGAITPSSVTLTEHLAVLQVTAPTIAADANAGTAASASNSGADLAGSISLTTGTAAWASGVQATLTFNIAFASAPKVILTPTNSDAAAAMLGMFVTKTTTTLSINFVAADVAQTTYTWDYHCI